VPLVLTTHLAREGRDPVGPQADQRPARPLPRQCVCLRIIDQPKEFAQA
jgi:hypothetical protein